jgi:hypothetical protein
MNILDHIENQLIFSITSDRSLYGSIHMAFMIKVKQELHRFDQQFAKVLCGDFSEFQFREIISISA